MADDRTDGHTSSPGAPQWSTPTAGTTRPANPTKAPSGPPRPTAATPPTPPVAGDAPAAGPPPSAEDRARAALPPGVELPAGITLHEPNVIVVQAPPDRSRRAGVLSVVLTWVWRMVMIVLLFLLIQGATGINGFNLIVPDFGLSRTSDAAAKAARDAGRSFSKSVNGVGSETQKTARTVASRVPKLPVNLPAFPKIPSLTPKTPSIPSTPSVPNISIPPVPTSNGTSAPTTKPAPTTSGAPTTTASGDDPEDPRWTDISARVYSVVPAIWDVYYENEELSVLYFPDTAGDAKEVLASSYANASRLATALNSLDPELGTVCIFQLAEFAEGDDLVLDVATAVCTDTTARDSWDWTGLAATDLYSAALGSEFETTGLYFYVAPSIGDELELVAG